MPATTATTPLSTPLDPTATARNAHRLHRHPATRRRRRSTGVAAPRRQRPRDHPHWARRPRTMVNKQSHPSATVVNQLGYAPGHHSPHRIDSDETDGDFDGVCANVDCDDNDPQQLPNLVGDVCDDGDNTTVNDVIGTNCTAPEPHRLHRHRRRDGDGVCAADVDDDNDQRHHWPGRRRAACPTDDARQNQLMDQPGDACGDGDRIPTRLNSGNQPTVYLQRNLSPPPAPGSEQRTTDGEMRRRGLRQHQTLTVHHRRRQLQTATGPPTCTSDDADLTNIAYQPGALPATAATLTPSGTEPAPATRPPASIGKRRQQTAFRRRYATTLMDPNVKQDAFERRTEAKFRNSVESNFSIASSRGR